MHLADLFYRCEATGILESRLRKLAGQNAQGGYTRAARGLVRRVPGHDHPSRDDAQTLGCQADEFRARFTFLDVLPAGDYIDQVVDTKYRAVVLQYGVCAIGRDRDLAASALDGFKQEADTCEGSDGLQVSGLEILALRL